MSTRAVTDPTTWKFAVGTPAPVQENSNQGAIVLNPQSPVAVKTAEASNDLFKLTRLERSGAVAVVGTGLFLLVAFLLIAFCVFNPVVLLGVVGFIALTVGIFAALFIVTYAVSTWCDKSRPVVPVESAEAEEQRMDKIRKARIKATTLMVQVLHGKLLEKSILIRVGLETSVGLATELLLLDDLELEELIKLLKTSIDFQETIISNVSLIYYKQEYLQQIPENSGEAVMPTIEIENEKILTGVKREREKLARALEIAKAILAYKSNSAK